MSRLSIASEAGIYEQAKNLRAQLCGIIGIPAAHQIILTGGTTVGLKLILAGLRSETLILGPEEYQTPAHFFPLHVAISSIAELQTNVQKTKPHAVILSVVSWRGRRFPVEAAFHGLRAYFKENCPLLIADYSHAGAAGFPDPTALGADLIAGDLSKWLLPPRVADDLCFIYPATSQISSLCQDLFKPLFLATETEVERSARWISPEQIVSAHEFLLQTCMSMTSLKKQHQKNVSFKRQVLESLDGRDTDTCMLWLRQGDAAPDWIAPDLIWRTPEGVRVMCREDIQQLYKEESISDNALGG
jgi:hypothetical protein